MGDVNQLIYLKQRMGHVEGSILEVGSKDYGSTVPFSRELQYTGRYVGVDMEDGPGVDVVGDLSLGLCGLEPGTFALVICCSVLEHVKRPWDMAANIERLVQPGGIMELFRTLAWREPCFATYLKGEFIPIGATDAQQICDRLARFADTPVGKQKYLPYMQVLMLGYKPQ
jgi:methyltransferase family protein